MASSVSSPSSPNPVGLWFCQISSVLQGRCQGGRADPPQGPKSGAGGAEGRQGRAPDAAGSKGDDDTPRRTCRGDAMPEATVYLLLDRFAPS
ncbi:hypothetical protein SETIT_9G165700v2 [Setaria italica]|uniref:Uncharacterized protein n=1 Tax=Setaria italica TaxID=4555 RepID=K4AH81_SETIT|nr:uncharacterized protein LOC101779456 [Setaria italica]RCV41820.1 hypothetical protein SETIT_9G165700v2 [Setaria italica]